MVAFPFQPGFQPPSTASALAKGTVMVCSAVQPEKAPEAIEVTVTGTVKFATEVQPAKALAEMLSNAPVMFSVVMEEQLAKAFEAIIRMPSEASDQMFL